MNLLFPLVLATFASGTQSYVFAGLLSEIAADLGVSISAAGLISAAFAVTFAIAAPLAALLAGGIDRRTILSAALFATAAVNLVAAMAPNLEALVGLRIAAAIAAAFVNPIASATAVMLVAPERRGPALAMVTAGLTVAFTVGIPLGSVVGGVFGWRATFVFAGLLAAMSALIVRMALPAVPSPEGPRQGLAGILGKKDVLSSFALTFLGFAATFTVVAYTGPVVNAATGLAGAAVGPFQAAVGVGSLIGVMVGGRIADGRRDRAALVVIFVVMALTLAAYSPLIAYPGGMAPALLLGLVILIGAAALFTQTPLIQMRLAGAAPAAGPLLFGLNATMIFAGQGAGALIGGAVTELFGFAVIGLAGAGIAVLAIAVTLLTIRSGRTGPTLLPAEQMP